MYYAVCCAVPCRRRIPKSMCDLNVIRALKRLELENITDSPIDILCVSEWYNDQMVCQAIELCKTKSGSSASSQPVLIRTRAHMHTQITQDKRKLVT